MSAPTTIPPHPGWRARPRRRGTPPKSEDAYEQVGHAQFRGVRAFLKRARQACSKESGEVRCSEAEQARPGEAGEATIEFIGVMMILVIPIFYFIVTLGALQSAVYAAEASARNAVRIVANNPQHQDAARLQGYLTFQDYNIADSPEIIVNCQPSHCQPGGNVEVVVSTSVPLPFLPAWLASGMSIPVEAQANMPIAGVELR